MDIGLEDGKFVVAKPAEDILVAHGREQVGCESLEKTIAGGVPAHVVQRLERIEIEQMKRERMVAATRSRDEAAHLVDHQGAVGQTRQGIVMGKMAQMGLGPLVRRDIERSCQDGGDAACLVAQRRFGREKHAPQITGARHFLLEPRQRLALGEDHAVERGGPHRAIRIEEGRQRFPHDLGRVDMVEAGLAGVDEDQKPVLAHRVNHGRQRIDHLGQPLDRGADGLFARLFARRKFARQRVGAVRQQHLVLAQHQEIARACHEFGVIHGRMQKIRCARFQRLQARRALLVDRGDYERNFGQTRKQAQGADEIDPGHAGHLVVGHDEIGRVRPDPGQRLARIGERAHIDIGRDGAGEFCVNRPIGGPVIDDHDVWHGSRAPHRKPPFRKLLTMRQQG